MGLYLGWPNRADVASVSGGSWLTALPLANLLTRQMTEIARSVSLADTYMDFDFSTTRTLRAFAMVNHNLSQAATWRLTLGSTAGASDIYDSGGLAVWRLSFDSDLLEWEDNNWWVGDYDDEYVGHPFAAIFVAPSEVSSRYMRITITDTFNPAGYVQLGRVFAGTGIAPAVNFSYGKSDAWESLSLIETAPGGTDFFDERRSYRVATFFLDKIGQELEFRKIYEMIRRQGITGEILWVPEVTDMAASQLTGFVGRMRQLSPLELPMFGRRKTGFEIKELL